MPKRGELSVIWKEICAQIQRRVSSDTFRRWFSGTMLQFADEERLVVCVPNHIYQVWIESNYLGTLNHAVAVVLQAPRDIEFVVKTKKKDGAAASEADYEAGGGSDDVSRSSENVVTNLAPLKIDAEFEKVLKRAKLNPRYHFEGFVVGATNEFAAAACRSVAAGPAQAYNPLFLYGPAGIGKTHLLHAIGQEILRRKPGSRVVYVTSEQFTNEFIDALLNTKLTRFRNRYRQSDVLLIDDVQFFAGKERSQEEFFHTFNSLSDGRRQIVLTSDRPANEISNLEDRIVTRCEWGLTADLEPPDVETRIAILRRKMSEWNVTLADHIVEFLADRIRKSVRRLEGGLVRLASYASLSGKALTEEVIEGLLKDILREEGRRRVTVNVIQKEVADHFDIGLADMSSRRRPANIAFPRQIAMYLTRTMTDMSLVEIGQAFGGRDHGTVIHACRQVEKRMEREKGIRQALASLTTRLSSG